MWSGMCVSVTADSSGLYREKYRSREVVDRQDFKADKQTGEIFCIWLKTFVSARVDVQARGLSKQVGQGVE